MPTRRKKPKAPGKSFRKGITLLQLADLFPDEDAAVKWFESIRWPEERPCPRCGSCATIRRKSGKPMPYHCRSCRKYFRVRTGSVMERSHIPLRKWAYAIYLSATSLKGVSSMKLHRDLGVSQKSAWFMSHRIREAFTATGPGIFSGPLEIDETYIGGKRKNMPKKKRAQLTGRGAVGKMAVTGIKDRPTKIVSAKVVPNTQAETLLDFISGQVEAGAMHYTDDAAAYQSLPNQETVKHSVGEYVRGQAHTNGIESFRSMLKRSYTGTFHKMSPKHLQRYVEEFSARHNIRPHDTMIQLQIIAANMIRSSPHVPGSGQRQRTAEWRPGRMTLSHIPDRSDTVNQMQQSPCRNTGFELKTSA